MHSDLYHCCQHSSQVRPMVWMLTSKTDASADAVTCRVGIDRVMVEVTPIDKARQMQKT